MGRRERREQERKERKEQEERRERRRRRASIQSPSVPDVCVTEATDSAEVPQQEESRLSPVFDWIDIAFQLFFIFQLLRLWIDPDPRTAGDLLESVEVLLIVEFSMIPFKLVVLAVGRKYGLMVSFVYYGFMSLCLIGVIKNSPNSFIFLLMLLNRMGAICMGKMSRKRMVYIAMSVGVLLVVLFTQLPVWFLSPSLGLTERFLESISYKTEFMDAKFQVLYLIQFYVGNIALIIIMRYFTPKCFNIGQR